MNDRTFIGTRRHAGKETNRVIVGPSEPGELRNEKSSHQHGRRRKLHLRYLGHV